MAHDRKMTQAQAEAATKEPLGLHISSSRNDFALVLRRGNPAIPRAYLRDRRRPRAGFARLYDVELCGMQTAADQAVRDGLHSYDRRHGWRGKLPEHFLRDHLGTPEKYQNDEWRDVIQKGDYVTGLVTAVEPTFASIKLGAITRC